MNDESPTMSQGLNASKRGSCNIFTTTSNTQLELEEWGGGGGVMFNKI
jgi:hypothetical protein